jgi:hypothetical protein
VPRVATKSKPAVSVESDAQTVSRVVRVPLEMVRDETWRDLRRLAYHCATFGNTLLSESYTKAKGLKAEFNTYTDFNEMLSAGIRDAVSRECVGLWRRLGRVILRGEQTLARFSADRALVVRGRGVRLERNGDGIVAQLRLHPRSQAEVTELKVWPHALKRDRYLRTLLDNLAAGEWKIAKGTILFRRPGRKIFLLLSYNKPLEELVAGSETATCEITADALVVRATTGHRLALGDRMHRLSAMKEHYAGIRRRLHHDLNKRGSRYKHRQALLKAGSFEKWAQGPLHELSRHIIDWCRAENCGELRWIVAHDAPELSWDKLERLCGYKAGEAGIKVATMERSKPPTAEAEKSGK